MRKPLTTGEAGKYCNVTYVTIIRWIKQGKIKAYKTPGGRYRIQPSDLVEFLRRYEMPVPEELQSKTKILVVDDDPEMLHVIIHALESENQNYELASALGVYDAARQITKFKPHVVILDIKMPGGIQVCKDIKSDAETKEIRILAITGNADGEQVKEILRCGAEHCLFKPFKMDELRKHIAKLSQNERTGNISTGREKISTVVCSNTHEIKKA